MYFCHFQILEVCVRMSIFFFSNIINSHNIKLELYIHAHQRVKFWQQWSTCCQIMYNVCGTHPSHKTCFPYGIKGAWRKNLKPQKMVLRHILQWYIFTNLKSPVSSPNCSKNLSSWAPEGGWGGRDGLGATEYRWLISDFDLKIGRRLSLFWTVLHVVNLKVKRA